jgi:hypothetical protein
MINRDQSTLFMEHIQKHAPIYYPDIASGQFNVRLLDKRERPTAMIYRFGVSNNLYTRSIFVKVPLRGPIESQTSQNTFEKPLLFSKTIPSDMHRLQYTALQVINEYFTSLNMEHLGAIRVLDYLPQYHAIFSEESSDPSLQQLFFKENRLRFPFGQPALTTAFQNVGIWLNLYNAIPKKEDVTVRHQFRNDYIEAITILTDFLTKALRDEMFFKETCSLLTDKASEVLPELLPLGLGHGDYAMRNILIGPQARVTVLDTFAKWQTPIYEDVGYFLVGLKMCYPQVVSQGLAFDSNRLVLYERAFLEGYFGKKPIPYPAVRLYEALALLDKWSDTIAKIHKQTKLIKFNVQLKSFFVNQYFMKVLKKLLVEIVRD